MDSPPTSFGHAPQFFGMCYVRYFVRSDNPEDGPMERIYNFSLDHTTVADRMVLLAKPWGVLRGGNGRSESQSYTLNACWRFKLNPKPRLVILPYEMSQSPHFLTIEPHYWDEFPATIAEGIAYLTRLITANNVALRESNVRIGNAGGYYEMLDRLSAEAAPSIRVVHDG